MSNIRLTILLLFANVLMNIFTLTANLKMQITGCDEITYQVYKLLVALFMILKLRFNFFYNNNNFFSNNWVNCVIMKLNKIDETLIVNCVQTDISKVSVSDSVLLSVCCHNQSLSENNKITLTKWGWLKTDLIYRSFISY